MIAGGAAQRSSPRRLFSVEHLETRRLLSGITFNPAAETPLPTGFKANGALYSPGNLDEIFVKSASGGGLIYDNYGNGSLAFNRAINLADEVLQFSQVTFSTAAQDIPAFEFITSKAIYTELASGNQTLVQRYTFPSDAIPNSFSLSNRGFLFNRFIPGAGNASIGTLELANILDDRAPETLPTAEVDTVVDSNISKPPFEIPSVNLGVLNGGSGLIADGRVFIENRDGTFAAAPAGMVDLSGARAGTKLSRLQIDTSSNQYFAAFPVDDGSTPSDAAQIFSVDANGAVQTLRTVVLADRGQTSGTLLSGDWSAYAVQDIATELVSGPGSPAIEILPGQGGTTLGAPILIPGKTLDLFASTSPAQPPYLPGSLIGIDHADQGDSLVVLVNSATQLLSGTVGQSVNPAIAGEPVTLTGFFPGFDGAAVSVSDGARVIAHTVLVNGALSVTLSNLTVGVHHLSLVLELHGDLLAPVIVQTVKPAPANTPHVALIAQTFTPATILADDQSTPAGSSINVTLTLKNIGSAASSGSFTLTADATASSLIQQTTPIPLQISNLRASRLSLAPGARINLTATLALPPGMAPNTYTISAHLNSDVSLHLSSALATPIVLDPALMVTWGFGQTTTGHAYALTRDLVNGNVVTFSLTGPGEGIISVKAPDFTLANTAPDYDVQVDGTAYNSNLVITQTGTTQSNIVSLEIDSNSLDAVLNSADLRQDTPHSISTGALYGKTIINSLLIGTIPLAAKRVDFTSGVATLPGSITGYGAVRSLTVNSLNHGSILLTPNVPVPMILSINTLDADSSVQTTQPIAAMNLQSAALGSSIIAASIGSLITTGDFDATLTLTDITFNALTLGVVQIGGNVAGAADNPVKWWTGNIGSIRITGNASYLQLVAGIVPAVDDAGLLITPVHFVYRAASVGRLTIGGALANSAFGAGVDLGSTLALTSAAKILPGGQIQSMTVGSIDSATLLQADQVAVPQTNPDSHPSQLVWTGEPIEIAAGRPLPTLRVSLEDAIGKLIDAGQQVTLRIANGPNAGQSIAISQLVSGVAEFPNIRFTKAGIYNLVADIDGTIPSLSKSFTVIPSAPTHLKLESAVDSSANYYIQQTVAIDLLDRYGNPVYNTNQTLAALIDNASFTQLNAVARTQDLGGPFINGVMTFFITTSKPGRIKMTLVPKSRRIPTLHVGILVG